MLSVKWLHARLSQKINIPLYTNDKKTEKEIMEIIPFKMATNNINYIGITVIKQVRDMKTIISSL